MGPRVPDDDPAVDEDLDPAADDEADEVVPFEQLHLCSMIHSLFEVCVIPGSIVAVLRE